MYNDNIPLKRGREIKKTLVVGIVARGGDVVTMKQNELKSKDLKKIANRFIDFKNTIPMTDNYRNYISFKNLIDHQTVNHSRK
jgi:hypothetical protein